jgi:hypothetical protein
MAHIGAIRNSGARSTRPGSHSFPNDGRSRKGKAGWSVTGRKRISGI